MGRVRRSTSSARRQRLAAVLVAVAVGCLAPSAAAQDGVTIDPASPSGTEYELPLESARRAAQPGVDPAAPVPQGARDAAPFGAGITAAPERRRSARPSSKPRRSGSVSERSISGSAVVRAAASHPVAPGPSAGMTALSVAAGLAVVLAGAAGGLAVRRRRTRP